MAQRRYQSTMDMFRRGPSDDDKAPTPAMPTLAWRTDQGVLWATTPDFALPPPPTADDDEAPLSVAAFDADGTLVDTRSGRALATSGTDWKFRSPRVCARLAEMHDDGHVIALFTNQSGVSTGRTPGGMIRHKMAGIALALGVPCAVLVSVDYGASRKPATGMWTVFQRDVLRGRRVDLPRSFFVGDAAGRPPPGGGGGGGRGGRGGDFSDSDRKFAVNVGLRFYTPEEFFERDSDASVRDLPLAGVDPQRFLSSPTAAAALQPADALRSLDDGEQQLIVLVGYPGSGKSSLVALELTPRGVVRVNLDTLKSTARCLATAQSALRAGKSVVVDNTNPRISSRAPYLALAKAQPGVIARAFVFMAPRALAEHLNALRAKLDIGRPAVPPRAYDVFDVDYAEPTAAEGFRDVVRVHFVPRFDDEEHRRRFLERT